MLNVTVVGGFGGFNIGDEAILRSLAMLAENTRRLHVHDVITFGRARGTIVSEQEELGFAYHNYFKLLRTAWLVTRSHLIVGGGAIIQERGFLWPYFYISSLIILNRLAGKRPVLLGVGADRPAHWLSRFFARHFFGLAAVISCRDQSSMRVLRELNIPRRKLVLASDFAFALPASSTRVDGHHGVKPLRVLLVPGYDKKYRAAATVAMREILGFLIKRGYQIIVMPHDTRVDYDLGEVARVCEGYSAPTVSTLIPNTLSEALAAYASVDLVISNRLHPLILGAIHSAVPIAAAHTMAKVTAFVELFGTPDLGDAATVKQRLSLVEELSDERISRIRIHLGKRVAKMRALAHENLDHALAAWGI